MTDVIGNLAWRTLRKLSSYRHNEHGAKTDCPADLPLGPGETCFGVYENFPGQAKESLIVTNLGLYVRRQEHWESLRYQDIETIATPTDKASFTSLDVRLQGGKTVSVPIRGGKGKFRDAFIFLHFMDRVKDWQQRQQPEDSLPHSPAR